MIMNSFNRLGDPFSAMDGYREDLEKQKLLNNERVLNCQDNIFGYPYFKKRSNLGELTEDEDEEMEVGRKSRHRDMSKSTLMSI